MSKRWHTRRLFYVRQNDDYQELHMIRVMVSFAHKKRYTLKQNLQKTLKKTFKNG
jgi:hypothetical protein